MTRPNIRFQTLPRQLGFMALLALGLLSTLATGGGGGGGGAPNTAPRISNLVLSTDSVAFMAGGGRTTIQAQLDYTDPERDLASVQVEISDGSSLTIPIPAVSASSGTIVGELEFSTDASGVFTAEVWIEDRAGNESNRLTATLTILGSADLSALSLAGITLDQAFDPALTTYTATVEFDVDTTTVTATTLDPSASFTVNGTAVDSGVPSGSIALAEGANTITMQVMAEPGTMSRTYTVTLTRRANARLADLTISAGQFDQIFQPNQPDYTATVGFLIPTTTVTATTEDPNATVTVNGVSVTTGTPSNTVSLDQGSNTISVVVTGSDGVSTAGYGIDVIRGTVATFAQQAYVKASNPGIFERFSSPVGTSGTAVALSGNTLAVGARSEDSGATGINGDQADNSALGAGAVYVFTRSGAGVWSQQAYIKASNTDAGDNFGSSVALSGNTLVVGAPREESAAMGINGDQSNNNADGSGAVYVFTRDEAAVWSQQAYIKASNTEANDTFGHSVAVSGNMLTVGARSEDSAASSINGDQSDNSADGSGAVYVFTRDEAGVWSQEAYIKASNPDARDRFGWKVALSGDTLAVSATGEDSAATGINGDQGNDAADVEFGAVYVFTRDSASQWSQQAYIKASNAGGGSPAIGGDHFGSSIALSGDTLAVGALFEESAATGIDGDQSDNSARQAGAVYVFTRAGGGVWSQQAYIKASNTDARDAFGSSVALSGDTLAVGASLEDSAATGLDGDQINNTAENSGAVYVFARDEAGVWSQQAYVKASNTRGPVIDSEGTDYGVWFGASLALSEDTLAVGSPGESSDATGVDGEQSNTNAIQSGAVYVFQ